MIRARAIHAAGSDFRGAARAGTIETAVPSSPLPPLHDAIDNADLTRLRALLAAGADVEGKDRWGQTPLHRAVGPSGGWRAGVEALLDAGADPNARLADGTTVVKSLWSGVASALEATYAREIETILRARGFRDA